MDDTVYMQKLAIAHHVQLQGFAREGADLSAARNRLAGELDDYLRGLPEHEAGGLRHVYEQAMRAADARTDLEAMKAEHAAQRRHRAAALTAAMKPTTQRGGLRAAHWTGIAIAALIVGLILMPESEERKAQKAAQRASADALLACQKRIAASLGIRTGEVGYTAPRAVEGGYQMLWPKHSARCEVRARRVVELVVSGRQVI